MKVIILLIVQVLAVIGANVGFFWACIEFILYLVKDKEFNWLSVWLFVASTILALGSVLYAAYLKSKNQKNRTTSINRESKFRKRLREAMEKADTK
jgi:uncharacterized membrane protein YpjA